MKPILKPKSTLTLSFKLTIIIVFLILIGSLFLSIQYIKENKLTVTDFIIDDTLPLPECSQKGGFYTAPFSVTLTSNLAGSKIFYTLDGSEPCNQSQVYSNAISIENSGEARLVNIPTSPRWKPPIGEVFNGIVLRAVTVFDNNRKSAELIRTFFIDQNSYKRYTFPIVALTVNQDDLFGFKNGIYVLGKNYEDKDDYIRKNIPLSLPWWKYPSNYLKRGNNAERSGHIEFYEPNGQLGFECNTGIRIHGNATRGFSQKSLRICFDKKYSSKTLYYPLFSSDSIEISSSFILRNGGNDWAKTIFRNELIQSLMNSSYLDVQASRPSIVFINGEYWGIHTICERFDNDYIFNKYHLDPDSVSILEINGGKLMGNKKKEVSTFEELLLFVKNNDLTQKANYEYLERRIDINSFIDIIIANVYTCNNDWPDNNVKFWRYQTEINDRDSSKIRDGRWRWMLYDTDWGFGFTGNNAVQLNLLKKAESSAYIGVIFGKLLKNEIFLNKFSSRFQYHLTKTFNLSHVINQIDLFKKLFAPEMVEHINRWRVIGSYSSWEGYIEELKDFAKKRSSIQQKQLKEFLDKQQKKK